MALEIAATPVLQGEEAARFLEAVAQRAHKRQVLQPSQKIHEAIQRAVEIRRSQQACGDGQADGAVSG